MLLQDQNNFKITKKNIKSATKITASPKQIEDLLFAFKVVKHLKSNAIVLVKNKKTLGIGSGQMSRVDSTRLAIMKIKDNKKINKFVCASDAFFPFKDSIELLKKNNCIGIIQPSGSINDNIIRKFASKNNMFLYYTKKRVFKH